MENFGDSIRSQYGLIDELLGECRVFNVMDAVPHNLPREHVDDCVELELLPSGAPQHGDIPRPKLVRSRRLADRFGPGPGRRACPGPPAPVTVHDAVGRSQGAIDLAGIGHPPHGLGDREPGILFIVDASEELLLFLRADPVRICTVTVADCDTGALVPPAVPIPGLVREPKQQAGPPDPITDRAQCGDYAEEDIPSSGFFSQSGRPGSGSSR